MMRLFDKENNIFSRESNMNIKNYLQQISIKIIIENIRKE